MLCVILVIANLITQYHSSTSLTKTKLLSDSVAQLIQVNQTSDSLNILKDSLQKLFVAQKEYSKTEESTTLEHIVVRAKVYGRLQREIFRRWQSLFKNSPR